tara:strand:- start:43 stop:369 length:327 start_codon:yes stop_codon:yes gene_type:complete
MRLIESQMVNAVAARRNWQSGNTQVTKCDRGMVVYLHGNQIAQLEPDDQCLWVTDAGWQTSTTKSRLNALLSALCPGCGIHQKQFVWYLTRHGKDQAMNHETSYAVYL